MGGEYRAAASWSTRRLTIRLWRSMVICSLVFSRMALPLGAKQVPLSLLLAIGHLALIALATRGTCSLPRAVATAVVVAVVLIETLAVHARFSSLSVLYLLAIYVPIILSVGLDEDALRDVWRTFLALMAGVAALGVAQVAGQVVAGGWYIDPVTDLPETLQLAGYQPTYPILRGVIHTLKPNGMIFVEASVFSQFMALALLGEAWLDRRASRLVLFGVALTLAFSGTGLLVLAGGLVLAGHVRLLFATGLAGVAVALAVGLLGYGEAFTSRIDEVRRPGTSGHERFVAPLEAMAKPWRESGEAVAWGYGAGRVEDLDVNGAPNYSAVPKVFLEYGLAGLAAFAALWLSMFRGLVLPRQLTGALAVAYFVAGGALLQPFTVFSLWGLTGGFLKRSGVVMEESR